MPRVTRGLVRHRKQKKILKAAKGYRGGRSKLLRTAKETVNRSMAYAYRDRKQRKRQMRRLWIIRINAASRNLGLSYSQFMHGLAAANVDIDRKALADLAVRDADAFSQLVDVAKAKLA